MTATKPKFLAFPDVEGLHNVVRFARQYPQYVPGRIAYRGKIKLHGTNAGITVGQGDVLAQSRSQGISVHNDNCGFAQWVEFTKEYWTGLSNSVKDETASVTVFGEWCGPGIMKGTAINKIPSKVFAVFAIATPTKFIVDPELIKVILYDAPKGTYVLPWHGDAFEVDFGNEANLRDTADKLNGVLATVEPLDPWVKEVFGIDGTAEGLVYYPSFPGYEAGEMKLFENYAFKVKGEKHRVVQAKEAVQVDPTVVASVEAFVTMFVTEARLEQGLAAIGGSAEAKNTPAFLKWFSQDVQKESVAELEAAKLTWDQVQRQIQSAARTWFMAKSKAI